MTELPPSRDAALRPEPLNGSSLLRQTIAALLMDEAATLVRRRSHAIRKERQCLERMSCHEILRRRQRSQ